VSPKYHLLKTSAPPKKFPLWKLLHNTVSEILKIFHVSLKDSENGTVMRKSAKSCQLHSNTANSCFQLEWFWYV